VNTLVNVLDINDAGWPCWMATMDTRGDAVKAGSLGDDAALVRASENAT